MEASESRAVFCWPVLRRRFLRRHRTDENGVQDHLERLSAWPCSLDLRSDAEAVVVVARAIGRAIGEAAGKRRGPPTRPRGLEQIQTARSRAPSRRVALRCDRVRGRNNPSIFRRRKAAIAPRAPPTNARSGRGKQGGKPRWSAQQRREPAHHPILRGSLEEAAPTAAGCTTLCRSQLSPPHGDVRKLRAAPLAQPTASGAASSRQEWTSPPPALLSSGTKNSSRASLRDHRHGEEVSFGLLGRHGGHGYADAAEVRGIYRAKAVWEAPMGRPTKEIPPHPPHFRGSSGGAAPTAAAAPRSAAAVAAGSTAWRRSRAAATAATL